MPFFHLNYKLALLMSALLFTSFSAPIAIAQITKLEEVNGWEIGDVHQPNFRLCVAYKRLSYEETTGPIFITQNKKSNMWGIQLGADWDNLVPESSALIADVRVAKKWHKDLGVTIANNGAFVIAFSRRSPLGKSIKSSKLNTLDIKMRSNQGSKGFFFETPQLAKVIAAITKCMKNRKSNVLN